ncbi:insulinase family protein [uncultured Psychrosphaera sp.]|uniref:insulinase family protein n=1 Tax=uncultured Psychrosphaera sp. TaxID=1403522 RepID=UPI0026397934|nr:insulinase family protein [uncultured Psychrosphaera sp.]
MRISPNDNKTYHSFTMLNGIKVLIIHSPDAHKSACSLVVNTGSFDDPTDRPGFAHFVEHLLFNGNKKYSQPAQLNDFVTKHGGHCNAWTATEHSSFHFDVHTDMFGQSLDYFANMFIEPSFTDEAIKKEQNAIHEEYKLKLKDDSRRIQQVHKETCNPQHPFHKFTVGNKHTLADLPQRPVKDELLQFWQTHYQSQFMTLCLISSLPVTELENKVSELFSNIKTIDATQTKPPLNRDLYRQQDVALFIAIEPVKELHKLNITFPLPGIDQFYKSKIVSFIAHLIGDEGEGSLFERLKDLGLINALAAGNGISGSNFKDFNISLELTHKGEDDLEVVLNEVFAYLNWIAKQTAPSYLYDEQRKLTEISFQYKEDIKPLALANNIAMNMQHYEEDNYIYGDYCMDGYSATQWHEFFAYINANNMRLTLVSQNIQTDKQAKWYHTPYYVEALSNEQIAQLNSQQCSKNQYHLPLENPYLAKSIKLELPDFDSQTPLSIDTELGWQAWFKQDVSFRVPKGTIYLGLDLPFGTQSKSNQAMMRFYCDLFMDTVSEQHYQAEMAGLHYNLYAHNAGMTLYTSGLSSNQDSLILTLLDNMLTIKFTTMRFDEVKRQLIKHWRNAETNKPISQLFSLLNSTLMPSTASSSELAVELTKVTFEQFESFCTELFSKMFTEILLYGNWTTAQASNINKKLKSRLQSYEKVTELPRSITSLTQKKPLYLDKLIEHNDNAALLYIQGVNKLDNRKFDYMEKAIFILISQILSPFSFNYLRTEKQLGYLAGSGYMPLCNTPGLVIYIQSHDYTSDTLNTSITDCLTSFIAEVEMMDIDELEQHKQAVIHQYNEQATNLNQKSQQLWVSIGNQDYSFIQKEIIAMEISTITKQQLTNWCNKKLNKENLRGIQIGSINATR